MSKLIVLPVIPSPFSPPGKMSLRGTDLVLMLAGQPGADYFMKHQHLVEEVIAAPVEIKVRQAVRDWCRLPYPRHPHGCPNYGHKPECPPNVPVLEPHGEKLILVGMSFRLDVWARKYKEKNPAWSDAQCRNSRYWQPVAKKHEKIIIALFSDHGREKIINPEARGVNLVKAMKQLGYEKIFPVTDRAWRLSLLMEKGSC